MALLVVSALGLSSCELLFMKTSADPSPLTVFDEIWGFVDTHYSFFALKDVDWNQIRAEYRPRVGSDMTDFELFDLLSEMLYELRDGHVNLRSPFDLSRHWEWYLGYPQNFDATLLEREYFRGDQEYAGPFVVYDFGDVAYLRYPSFSGTIASEHLDYLFTRFAGRAGLILDLRDNGGGSTSNAYRLANRLVDSRTERGYQQYKSGPGHEDFTEAQPVVIVPPAGAVLWQKPFVVLTNRSSYSATNTFVALAKGLDQVRVIGDTTGGGGGIPAYTELSNEWILRVSAHRFIAEDEGGGQLNIELGIDPDESVDMTDSDLELGKDTILEAALSYIREL